MRKLIARLRDELAQTDEHGAIAVALYIAVAACVPQLALWSLLFHWYGVDTSAALYAGWAGFTFLGSVAVAVRRDWFSWFLAVVLFCTAAMNALASSELGGIGSSAGQIMWGLLAPMGALLYYGLRKAVTKGQRPQRMGGDLRFRGNRLPYASRWREALDSSVIRSLPMSPARCHPA